MSSDAFTRVLAEESLASYVRRLGAGSHCFCCGTVMRPARQSGAVTVDSGDRVPAVCPRCGSEVGVPNDDTQEAGRSSGRLSDSLVAAA